MRWEATLTNTPCQETLSLCTFSALKGLKESRPPTANENVRVYTTRVGALKNASRSEKREALRVQNLFIVHKTFFLEGNISYLCGESLDEKGRREEGAALTSIHFNPKFWYLFCVRLFLKCLQKKFMRLSHFARNSRERAKCANTWHKALLESLLELRTRTWWE